MTRAANFIGPLPAGGVNGAALVKKGAGDGDLDWSSTAAVVAPSSPTAFTQTYSTTAVTVPAATAVAVDTTAATNSSPYGFAQAQADAIVTAVNALIADVLAVRKTQNSIIDILQAAGLAS